MEINELKMLIGEKVSFDIFSECIRNEGYDGEENVSKPLGLPFEFLCADRDYSEMYYRFRIDGKTYQIGGAYDSWEGSSMDHIEDFYEVKPVEKTIIEWVAV